MFLTPNPVILMPTPHVLAKNRETRPPKSYLIVLNDVLDESYQRQLTSYDADEAVSQYIDVTLYSLLVNPNPIGSF